MDNSGYQLIADIISNMGVVGILIYTWWMSRQDMKDERARLEKQRLEDLARYEKEINLAFARFDRDLQIERNRADKWQAAVMSQLKKTHIPDTDMPTDIKPPRGL